jgi:hypothetical protein
VPQVQLPQTAAVVPLPLPLHAAKALLRQNPFAPLPHTLFNHPLFSLQLLMVCMSPLVEFRPLNFFRNQLAKTMVTLYQPL